MTVRHEPAMAPDGSDDATVAPVDARWLPDRDPVGVRDADVVVHDGRAGAGARRTFAVDGHRVAVVPRDRHGVEIRVHADVPTGALRRVVGTLRLALLYDLHLRVYYDLVRTVAPGGTTPGSREPWGELGETVDALGERVDLEVYGALSGAGA